MHRDLTTDELEAECRAFAAEFDLPNVHRAIRAAEDNIISWLAVYRLFTASLQEAMA